MKRQIIKTSDGSSTLYIEEWNEHYHSKHGALQEALYVFIKQGLQFLANKKSSIRILEMGFGSGLNALLTYDFAREHQLNIEYVGVEGFPLTSEEINALNYKVLMKNHDSSQMFDAFHQLPWNVSKALDHMFTIEKKLSPFEDLQLPQHHFDLIYFDAFGARVQPHLWEFEMLQKMYNCLNVNGVFVTYSAKGSVRRDLIKIGFEVERLDGPPGKRHMLRAIKI
ncbi:MAG: tRNA (5-methylaminomethyl-2-thiouridine)(34)-methyltransferase MnmD [bacterium]